MSSLSDPALLVMAAGMGSRYGGSKQTDGVGPRGETLLEYSMYDAWKAGFGSVYVVLREAMADDFTSRVISRLPPGRICKIVSQGMDSFPDDATGRRAYGRKKPWGTAHAAMCGAGGIDVPFAIVNADDYYGYSSLAAIRERLAGTSSQSPRFCMAGYPLRSTVQGGGSVSRALCDVGEDGRLRAVSEHLRIERRGDAFVSLDDDGTIRPLSGDSLVSMNLFGFTPVARQLLREAWLRFLADYDGSDRAEFGLPSFVNEAIAEGRCDVDVVRAEGEWFGMTYREDKARARSAIARLTDRGVYPCPLWGR